MNTLTIFHDPECGLCCNFKKWLGAQKSYPNLEFLPYQSKQARERFPLLEELNAGNEIVVLADDGRWWQGPSAWLTCLWTLKRYRDWSYRLATPALLPAVEKLCHLLSEKRLDLSQLLRLKPERLAHIVEELAPTCASGACSTRE